MVDLALSAEETQELLLTQLLPSVYKQQLIQHLQLQNDKQLLQDKLGSEEVRVWENNALAFLPSSIISRCEIIAVPLFPPTSLGKNTIAYRQ